WTRNSAGSIFVGWDIFGATSVFGDNTPDVGNFGTLGGAKAPILLTGKKGSQQAPQAFVTGSSNIYSFDDILAFSAIVQTNAAHQALGANAPITVALQLSILGSDIDDNSVKLFGQRFDTKTVLSTGSASGPSGQGGVDNEYLYLWHLTGALPVYL